MVPTMFKNWKISRTPWWVWGDGNDYSAIALDVRDETDNNPPLNNATHRPKESLHEKGKTLNSRRLWTPLLMLTLLLHVPVFMFWEDMSAPFRWRQLSPSRLSPLPDRTVPVGELSASFQKVLPIVTASRASRNEYRRLVREYTFANKTEKCGDWQGRYTELHHNIITGKVEGGILTADGPGGFSDKTAGLVSSFLLALLLDRAWTASSYFTHVVNKMPDIRFGFESPNINWARTAPVPEDSQIYNGLNIDRDLLLSRFVNISRSELEAAGNTPTVQCVFNRGIALNMMYDDTFWGGEKLRYLGFTKENIYSCVLNYLFRPIRPTLDLLAQYHGVLAHSTVLSIAIQLRLGDRLMRNNTYAPVNLHDYAWAFECAAAVSETYVEPQHQFLVFSVESDFYPLSHQAAVDISYFLPNWSHPKLGAPLVLNTGIKPHHVDDDQDNREGQHEISFEENEAAFQTTVLDSYILDSVDFRLASAHSGFAITSALRSWPAHGNHTISLGRGRDCTAPSALYDLGSTRFWMKSG